jgi:hypothetical protein
MMETELILLIIAGAFALVMACYIVRTGRREAVENFDYDYNVAVRFVNNCQKTNENRLKAKLWAIRLGKMPRADKEKIGVLKSEIERKFKNIKT